MLAGCQPLTHPDTDPGSSSSCLASFVPAHFPPVQASRGRSASWAPLATSCPFPSPIHGSPSAPSNFAPGTIFFDCIFDLFCSLFRLPPVFSGLLQFPDWLSCVQYSFSPMSPSHRCPKLSSWRWNSVHCSSVGTPCAGPRCLWNKGSPASTMGLVQFASSLFQPHYPLQSQKHDTLGMLN